MCVRRNAKEWNATTTTTSIKKETSSVVLRWDQHKRLPPVKTDAFYTFGTIIQSVAHWAIFFFSVQVSIETSHHIRYIEQEPLMEPQGTFWHSNVGFVSDDSETAVQPRTGLMGPAPVLSSSPISHFICSTLPFIRAVTCTHSHTQTVTHFVSSAELPFSSGGVFFSAEHTNQLTCYVPHWDDRQATTALPLISFVKKKMFFPARQPGSKLHARVVLLARFVVWISSLGLGWNGQNCGHR